MAPSLRRSGDAWLVTATLFLLCGVVFVALPSGRSTLSIVVALGGALALAAAFGAGLVRWREARRQPSVFLRPRQREAMVLAVAGLALVIPVVGILLRPAPPPAASDPPPTTTDISRSLRDQATAAVEPGTRAALSAAANIADALEARARENETTLRQGGPAAEEAARENREINDFLAALEPWAKGAPSGSRETKNPSPPNLSKLPPLPRLAQRPNDPDGSALASFFGLLTGPLGPILQQILGLGLSSGYRRQVESVSATMAGGVAPSVPQIEDLLGATDADQAKQAQAVLRRLAERQLAGAELQKFRDNLDGAAHSLDSAAQQILRQLEEDPETPPHVLLAYLGTSPPDHFASMKQQEEVRALLRERFPEVWEKYFASLEVQEGSPQEDVP